MGPWASESRIGTLAEAKIPLRMAGLVQGDTMIHNDSSSNTSQPTTTDAGLTQTSPSISASSLSQIEGSVYSRTKASPDNLQKIPYHEHDSNALEGLTSLSHSAGSNGSRSPASSQRTSSPEKLSSYNAGQKRTATGEIKSPGLGNSKSPFRGHSRHSSTLSNGSTVTEVCRVILGLLGSG